MGDAPVLGCAVTYTHQKDSGNKGQAFAFRNYVSEMSKDTGIATTWEFLGHMKPGIYTIGVRAFNCAGTRRKLGKKVTDF